MSSSSTAISLPYTEPIATPVIQDAPKDSRVTIFSGRLETLNMAFGWLTLLVLPLSFWWVGEYGRRDVPIEIVIIFEIFLLNATHNAFSIILPLVSPEIRCWWREGRCGPFRVGNFILGFMALTFVAVFGLTLLALWTPYRIAALFAIMATLKVWTIRHSIGQTYGLSRLYDQRTREMFGPADARTLRSIEWQRKLIWTLLALGSIRALLSTVRSYEWALTCQMASVSLAVLMVAMVGAIVWLAFREPHAMKSNKPLYLSRLVVISCAGLGSVPAYCALMFLHSFEHGVVTYTAIKNSKENEARGTGRTAKRYWAFAIGLVGLVVILAFTRNFLFGKELYAMFPENSWIIALLASISMSFTFTHFLMDELMFKMKNKEVREHVAPLLAKF